MSLVVDGHVKVEDPSAALVNAVAVTIELLDDERDAFLSGAYHLLPELSDRKLTMLKEIENCIQETTRSAKTVVLITQVIERGRRNEEIIRAAQQGLAFARRRIGQLNDTVSGAVAYAEDGSRIASRADMLGDTTSF